MFGFSSKGFRFVEKLYMRHNHYHVRRFNLEQWCPIVEKWHRMLLPGNWNQIFKSDNKTPVPNEKCIIAPRLLRAIENPPKAIIVVREKHGINYYDANSTEGIGRASLQILGERENQGYYSAIGELPEPPKHKPEYFDDPAMVNFCEKQWTEYARKQSYYSESNNFWTKVKRALKEDHYVLATLLLEDRNMHEYEGFEIEVLIGLRK